MSVQNIHKADDKTTAQNYFPRSSSSSSSSSSSFGPYSYSCSSQSSSTSQLCVIKNLPVSLEGLPLDSLSDICRYVGKPSILSKVSKTIREAAVFGEWNEFQKYSKNRYSG